MVCAFAFVIHHRPEAFVFSAAYYACPKHYSNKLGYRWVRESKEAGTAHECNHGIPWAPAPGLFAFERTYCNYY